MKLPRAIGGSGHSGSQVAWDGAEPALGGSLGGGHGQAVTATVSAAKHSRESQSISSRRCGVETSSLVRPRGWNTLGLAYLSAALPFAISARRGGRELRLEADTARKSLGNP